MNDVRPDQYPDVIRDLIKHEDDVTNHRLMRLLIVQGLLVNDDVVVRADARAACGIATLSSHHGRMKSAFQDNCR